MQKAGCAVQKERGRGGSGQLRAPGVRVQGQGKEETAHGDSAGLSCNVYEGECMCKHVHVKAYAGYRASHIVCAQVSVLPSVCEGLCMCPCVWVHVCLRQG